RSIMVIWDNSGSTGTYHEGMYQAMARLADDIKPGFEVVNLMPMGEYGVEPLLEKWSSNPLDIKAAIGGYDRGAASSMAETTLLTAMDLFVKRSGNRAILLMTDAESGGGTSNSVLWQRFREVRPRVFTLELQIESHTETVSHYQDLMQNWAAVNHGDYRVFRSQADLDHAFERAACLLRSPAEYSVSWQPAPGKGDLRVVWESGKAMAGAAVELVLDASGSMRSAKSKVGGKLKMEVAREVMQEIIQALPDDTQVGLRVYGHRVREGTAGDCEDSELVAPIALLDRTNLAAAVSKVQALGTTPIAYSIGKACEDLAKIEGPKLLVVITDGKEECGGDPQAAVAACRAAGLDVRVDIVGFALADAKDKSDMESAAAQGAGRFFDAQDRSALSAAIEESLAMPFDVFDSRDTSIAQGLTGLQGQGLYEGNYTVAVHTASGDVTVRDVAIQQEKITTVYLSREGDGIRFRTEEAQ
ncbi:MAG: VWA domain-containing protein, partial [Burkholderiales bacterium]|nr:VWA domain-containing protein [Burkholderiales bacterium]